MSDDIRLVIAIPTAGTVKMGFAYSLAGLIGYLAAHAVPSRPEAATFGVAANDVQPLNTTNLSTYALDFTANTIQSMINNNLDVAIFDFTANGISPSGILAASSRQQADRVCSRSGWECRWPP